MLSHAATLSSFGAHYAVAAVAAATRHRDFANAQRRASHPECRRTSRIGSLSVDAAGHSQQDMSGDDQPWSV